MTALAGVVELSPDRVMREVRVGDVVYIRGRVRNVEPGVGVHVELTGRTDHLYPWFQEEQIAAVVVPEVPDQPANGTWLVGPNHNDGGVTVYHRDDTGAPDDAGRRWPRCWQVTGTGEWVDWPTACQRGADPGRVLTPAVGADDRLTNAVLDALGRSVTRGFTMRQLLAVLHQRHSIEATPAQVRPILDQAVKDGTAEIRPAGGNLLDRWSTTRRA